LTLFYIVVIVMEINKGKMMTLLEQQSISGDDLISQLIQKEAERDSYTMDHFAWDILNQECKGLILGIVSRSDADQVIEQYHIANRPYKEIRQSGNFYGVSSYNKEDERKVTQYWDTHYIPVKIMYVLSGGDKMYHFNAYSLKHDVEKARCSDEIYARTYYEKLGTN
jgi:hypothetical protein